MGEPAKKGDSEEGTLDEKVLTHPNFQALREKDSSSSGFYRAIATVEDAFRTIEAENQRLKDEVERLRPLVVRDGLTGAYNHRYFREQLEIAVKESSRYSNPLSLMMIDIDHFKRFNDTYGHQAGDYVLKHLTEIAVGVLRETDIFARYGGEEFTVIMSNTTEEDAGIAAERLRQKIENTEFKYKGQKLDVSVSVGVASRKSESADDIIKIADKLLYIAKDSGRNRAISRDFAEKELGIDLALYRAKEEQSL
jgi:diguanylate cyclase (GGDEF)-like protein